MDCTRPTTVLIGSLLLTMVTALPVRATTITIVGATNGSQATASGDLSFNASTNTLTFSLLNTSPFDARITGIGFDLPPTGNASGSGLNGFTGSVVSAPPGTAFIFSDAALGNVPQFGSAVLDFGFITGNSGNFSGGSPNDGLAPGGQASFMVSGAGFTGFTEANIANSIYVRFQRVGENGAGSDVGTPSTSPPPVIPEPATLSLLGAGLAAAAWRRTRRKHRS